MNRGTLRLMSVLVGIALGTICAMAFRAYRVANTPSPSGVSANGPVEDEDDYDPWDRVHEKKEDPGRRNDLASLVKSAKAEPRWLKDFEFVDQNGNKVTTETLKGEPYVACFFFTTCKGSCPRQTSEMQLLQNKYKDKPIRFLSITVDPEIDTQEVLAKYAESFGADPKRWFFVRGELSYTERVGMEKFFLDGVEERGHPDRFVLVNAEGDPVGSYVWLDIDERDLLKKHMDELLGL